MTTSAHLRPPPPGDGGVPRQPPPPALTREGGGGGTPSGGRNGTTSARSLGPDPLSKSLDHLIPLSRGGTHEPANVSLAHLRCNVSRGAGRKPAQLWLIPS
jgi:HNH endonuclease